MNVALWAAGADGVELCVFDDDGTEHRIPLTQKVFNVFHGHIPSMRVGDRYGFRVHGPWDPEMGLRWNPNKLLLDPYARAIDGVMVQHPAIYGHVGSNDLEMSTTDSAPYVPRSVVVDDDFDWEGDTHLVTRWGDTVIYEAHVRGLTMRNPMIPEHLRGTYAGIGHPVTIDYLVDLGITAIELMPVHHFVDETPLLDMGLTNYWGYNSIGFFAPHARYSSSGTRGGQVREFKEMVKALHRAGIEVILDVVYNHTAEGNQLGPTLSFRGIDNDDYYRLSNGRYYSDYTGTGNTLNASRPHVLQLIMDSLRYWVTEMHVDGFRFDLASALARSMHDVDMLGPFISTIQQDPILRRVKLIAEPWDIGPGGYQVGEFPPLWTEWNDKYRDNIRDFWRGATGVGEFGWRLTGSADLYSTEGRRPFASINFVTAHDGFTLRDLVSYEHKHNLANGWDNTDGTDNNRSANYGIEGETNDATVNEIRQRQLRNFLTTLFVSTGVPMLVAGDEFGRTQQGNNNAYCQDNEISWLDWQWAPWQVEQHRFTRELIKLRQANRSFRRRHFFKGRPVIEGGPKDLAWIGPDGAELSSEAWASGGTKTIGMLISGLAYVGGGTAPYEDEPYLVIMHAGTAPVEFRLPGDPYAKAFTRVVDTVTGQSSEDGTVLLAGDIVTVAPRSALVLHITREG